MRLERNLTAALVVLLASLAVACRAPGTTSGAEGADAEREPDEYSARLIKTAEQEGKRQTSETRVVRSGGMLREEWTSGKERLALIWRPDLGKTYLLYLDKKSYVETATAPESLKENGPPQKTSSGVEVNADEPQGSGARGGQGAPAPLVTPDALDQQLGERASPTRVETTELADQMVGSYTCKVTERRSYYPDGHVEVVRTFRSLNLGGMSLKREMETIVASKVRARYSEEKAEIKTRVSADEFEVPADFTRIAHSPGLD